MSESAHSAFTEEKLSGSDTLALDILENAEYDNVTFWVQTPPGASASVDILFADKVQSTTAVPADTITRISVDGIFPPNANTDPSRGRATTGFRVGAELTAGGAGTFRIWAVWKVERGAGG